MSAPNTAYAAIGDDIISIEQVISSAKSVLRLDAITDYDSQIEVFVNEGASKLDCTSIMIKKPALLDIVDGKACLPKGYKQLIAARLVPNDSGMAPEVITDPYSTVNSTFVTDYNYDILYIDKDFISTCGLTDLNTPIAPLSGTIQINQGHIIFTYPLPSGVNQVLISYQGYNVDGDGLLYLMQKMEIGLRAYVAWRMYTIYPELWPKEYFQYYGPTVERYNQEWRMEFKKIIGDDAVRNFVNNRYVIKRAMNSLLHDQSH